MAPLNTIIQILAFFGFATEQLFWSFLCSPPLLTMLATYLFQSATKIAGESFGDRSELCERVFYHLSEETLKFLTKSPANWARYSELDKETWFAVQFVESLRGQGGLWARKGDGELEEMAGAAVDVLKAVQSRLLVNPERYQPKNCLLLELRRAAGKHGLVLEDRFKFVVPAGADLTVLDD
ncbi:hypothetical protein BKA64DRAFT_699349 [Cadophora sp. MPI-SDFR-AT-0126]|nr:hypothetical protein BKA64DRAFT_699349 [Leotiomycetes sp. MPI-SDFR-AT-0126]